MFFKQYKYTQTIHIKPNNTYKNKQYMYIQTLHINPNKICIFKQYIRYQYVQNELCLRNNTSVPVFNRGITAWVRVRVHTN